MSIIYYFTQWGRYNWCSLQLLFSFQQYNVQVFIRLGTVFCFKRKWVLLQSQGVNEGSACCWSYVPGEWWVWKWACYTTLAAINDTIRRGLPGALRRLVLFLKLDTRHGCLFFLSRCCHSMRHPDLEQPSWDNEDESHWRYQKGRKDRISLLWIKTLSC